MGSLDGKVALVTGAARGQGRAFALRMAAEGADIVAIDICGEAATVGYRASTREDLDDTTAGVEAAGARVLGGVVDVRDSAALEGIVAEAVRVLGGIDIAVANAGISSWGRFWEMSEERWEAMIDINLTGAWRTWRAVTPQMIEQGRGGSLIGICSVAGLKSLPGQGHYSAAKHGMVGLAKSAAAELGEYDIRVNTIHPWGVDTEMARDEDFAAILGAHPAYMASFASLLPHIAMASPDDIADTVLWLASDASRCVTGAQIPVDMGATKV